MAEHHPDTFIERGRATPLRSCAACRGRAPRERLLRFVALAAGGETGQEASARRVMRLDLARTLPGRGVNIGPSPLCLARAIKRGAFARQARVTVPESDLPEMVAATRAALVGRLGRYLASAWARGGLVPVAGTGAVEPSEARVLWESAELAAIVEGIPPARAVNPRIAAKIKALTTSVSEFTFTFVGGMKRRPEAPEACEALERCGGATGRGAGKIRRERVGAAPTPGPDGRNG